MGSNYELPPPMRGIFKKQVAKDSFYYYEQQSMLNKQSKDTEVKQFIDEVSCISGIAPSDSASNYGDNEEPVNLDTIAVKGSFKLHHLRRSEFILILTVGAAASIVLTAIELWPTLILILGLITTVWSLIHRANAPEIKESNKVDLLVEKLSKVADVKSVSHAGYVCAVNANIDDNADLETCVSIKLNNLSDRLFVPVKLLGGIQVMALFDSGSQVQLISKRLLQMMEQAIGSSIPRVKTNYLLKVYNNNLIKNTEGVALQLILGKTLLLKQVLFLIADSDTQLLLGSSLIIDNNAKITHKDGKYYLEFIGRPKYGKIPLALSASEFYPAQLVSAVQLGPFEEKIVDVQAPFQAPLLPAALDEIEAENEDQIHDGYSAPLADKVVEFFPSNYAKPLTNDGNLSLVTQRGSFPVLVGNKSEIPMKLEPQSVVGSFKVVNKGNYRSTAYAHKLNLSFKAIKKINSRCPCSLEKGGIIAQFADVCGLTLSNVHRFNEKNPLFGLYQDKVSLVENHLFFCSNQEESFAELRNDYITEFATRRQILGRAWTFLLPCTVDLSGEQRRILVHCNSIIANFQILSTRYIDLCSLECRSIGLAPIDNMRWGVKQTTLSIIHSGTEFAPFVYRKNKAGNQSWQSGALYEFKTLGCYYALYKFANDVNILLHIDESLVEDQGSMTAVIFTILGQLRLRLFNSEVLIRTTGPEIIDLKHPVGAAATQALTLLSSLVYSPHEDTNQDISLSYEHEPFNYSPEGCGCKCCTLKASYVFVEYSSPKTIYWGKAEHHDQKQTMVLNKSELDIISANLIGEEDMDSFDHELYERVYQLLIKWPSDFSASARINNDDGFMSPLPIEEIDSKDLSHIPEHSREKYRDLLREYRDIFTVDPTAYRLWRNKPLEFTVLGDTPSVPKIFHMSKQDTALVDSKVHSLLASGLIELVSTNPAALNEYGAAPMFLRSKPGESDKPLKQQKKRALLDLCQINSKLVFKNSGHAIPPITSLIAMLGGACLFTSCDLSSGYDQMALAKESANQCCLAVTSPTSAFRGHYFRLKGCPQGLALSPSAFAEVLQQSLPRELLPRLSCYIDDIILSKTIEGPPRLAQQADYEEHLKDIKLLFQSLRDINALVAFKKTYLAVKEIDVLGHHITIDPEGVPKVTMPEKFRKSLDGWIGHYPQTRKELSKFMGFCNWLSQYTPNLMAYLSPILDVLKTIDTKPKTKFELSAFQKRCFDAVIKDLQVSISLNIPSLKTTWLFVDSGLVSSSSMLADIDEKGKMRCLGFSSHRYPLGISLCYHSFLKEALGILSAVEHHRAVLYASQRVILVCDCEAVCSILACNFLSASSFLTRLAHRLYSLPFSWAVRTVPREQIEMVDFLQRRYQLTPEEQIFFAPFSYSADAVKEFFSGKVKLPPELALKPEITTQDLIKHIYETLEKSGQISQSLLQKRLQALNSKWCQLVDPGGFLDHTEESILAMKSEVGSNFEKQIVYSVEADLDPSDPVHMLECMAVVGQVTVRKNIHPNLPGITRNLILRLQGACPETIYIRNILFMADEKDIPPQLLAKYRLLDGALLVIRKNLRAPFSQAGNTKVYMSIRNAVYICALIHLLHCHIGSRKLNLIFSQSMFSTYAARISRIIVASCCHCSLYHEGNQRFVGTKRFPLPKAPFELVSIDLCYFDETLVKGTDCREVLVMVDIYSKLLIVKPMKNSKFESISNALQDIFSHYGRPSSIIADNGANLTRNAAIRQVIDKFGVQPVGYYFTSPYMHTNSYAESNIRILRAALALNARTYDKKYHEVLQLTVFAINSRPLTHLKYMRDGNAIYPSPISLFFGKEPVYELGQDIYDILSEEQKVVHRAEWEKLFNEINVKEDERLRVLQKRERLSFRPSVGTLCYVKRTPYDKHNTRFLNDLFEITHLSGTQATVKPYLTDERERTVHLSMIKIYRFHKLYEYLPEKITSLLLRTYSPEEIRARVSRKEVIDFLAEPEEHAEGRVTRGTPAVAPQTAAPEEDLLTVTSSGSSYHRDFQSRYRPGSVINRKVTEMFKPEDVTRIQEEAKEKIRRDWEQFSRKEPSEAGSDHASLTPVNPARVPSPTVGTMPPSGVDKGPIDKDLDTKLSEESTDHAGVTNSQGLGHLATPERQEAKYEPSPNEPLYEEIEEDPPSTFGAISKRRAATEIQSPPEQISTPQGATGAAGSDVSPIGTAYRGYRDILPVNSSDDESAVPFPLSIRGLEEAAKQFRFSNEEARSFDQEYAASLSAESILPQAGSLSLIDDLRQTEVAMKRMELASPTYRTEYHLIEEDSEEEGGPLSEAMAESAKYLFKNEEDLMEVMTKVNPDVSPTKKDMLLRAWKRASSAVSETLKQVTGRSPVPGASPMRTPDTAPGRTMGSAERDAARYRFRETVEEPAVDLAPSAPPLEYVGDTFAETAHDTSLTEEQLSPPPVVASPPPFEPITILQRDPRLRDTERVNYRQNRAYNRKVVTQYVGYKPNAPRDKELTKSERQTLAARFGFQARELEPDLKYWGKNTLPQWRNDERIAKVDEYCTFMRYVGLPGGAMEQDSDLTTLKRLNVTRKELNQLARNKFK